MSSRRTVFIGLAFCFMAAAAVPAFPKTDPVAAGRPAEDVFFTCELKGKEGILSSNTFHFSRLKRVSLPDPGVKAEVLEEKGGLVVRLTNAKPTKHVHLAAEGLAGRFADNFFDMLPGRTYTIAFLPASAAGLNELAGRLKVRTLRDSY